MTDNLETILQRNFLTLGSLKYKIFACGAILGPKNNAYQLLVSFEAKIGVKSECRLQTARSEIYKDLDHTELYRFVIPRNAPVGLRCFANWNRLLSTIEFLENNFLVTLSQTKTCRLFTQQINIVANSG